MIDSSPCPAPPPALEAEWTRADMVDQRLRSLLPAQEADALLGPAVREACLSRGKRVRPILAMLAAAHYGAEEAAALDFGCALELVHTASLILDDLPCMDDAALRRGAPAMHRRFGEDVAVLASVALLSHAFGVVVRDDRLKPPVRLDLQRLLTATVGVGGLVSGQLRDLREPPAARDEDALTTLNHQKTGVLFIAAVQGAAIIAGAGEATQARARRFGSRLGLAFQLLDDLHDCTGSAKALGKDVGQDIGRVTFVSLHGVEGTRRRARDTFEAALADLGEDGSPLALYVRKVFSALAHGA